MLNIEIMQGGGKMPAASDINVVIDVIRAFTVAHQAFIHGIKGIFLAATPEEDALNANTAGVSSGEVFGPENDQWREGDVKRSKRRACFGNGVFERPDDSGVYQSKMA